MQRSPPAITVALAVLKLAGPLPVARGEPMDAEEILRDDLERERVQLRAATPHRNTVDTMDGLPDYSGHLQTVRKRLARMAPATDTPTDET